MSTQETIGQRAILARAALGILLVGAFGGLGALLGWLSAPKPHSAQEESAQSGNHSQDPALAGPPEGPLAPLYFRAGQSADPNAASIILAEVGMAAQAGVGQVIVPVPLPWDDTDLDAVDAVIREMAQTAPTLRITLELPLDPPAAWLARHPDEQRVTAAGAQAHASVASALWRQEAGDRLTALLEHLGAGPHRHRVGGLVLAGLGNGQWISEGLDQSPAMREGFRGWLGRVYADDAGLAAAWGEAKAALAAVEVPAPASAEDEASGAFLPPAGRPMLRDFRRFTSEATASLIAAFAERARAAAWPGLMLWAPYGQNLENAGPDSGQHALGLLLESALDGFVGPFSYAERGLGGTGGPMATVHSARYHGKQWLFIDDTRTGIARDAVTGAITRLEGLREEDVHSVLARNFSLAFVHGMGIAWSDPQGEGTLHDERLWQRIGAMRALHEAEHPPAEAPRVVAPTLVVVYDEAATALTRDGAGLHERTLLATRDAALRLGVPVHFALLSDFLAGSVPAAPTYLFANTFEITPDERAALHARLAQQQAYAIWLYAPGYFGPEPAAANIAATVGMNVGAIKEGNIGSEFLFTGRWVEEGRALESPAPWAPLFHIEEPESDPLARYTGSERVSIAMRFLPEGWASVYIAEPSLSAPLLREILGIIEQPLPIRPSAQKHYDTIIVGSDLFAIHGRQTGERTIELGGFYDVVDLLDPEIGWPSRDNFVLSLKTGETRLLRRTPVEGISSEDLPPPDDAPLDGASPEAETTDPASEGEAPDTTAEPADGVDIDAAAQ
jgi:hypothetical protein